MSISQPPAGPAGNRPKLAVIGGRLEDDNDAVYREMHRLSGGRIVVFPTASSEPDAVGAETVAAFRAHGFDAALAPVHGPGAARAAHDPALAALVGAYGSVFFTGGNQAFITAALAPQGRATPLLDAIRTAHAAGGLVAGSSAGAAMMSDIMIEGGTSLEATTFGVVTNPDRPGLLLGRGLGFFPWGIVDQHFLKRGRFGRLVMAMAETGTPRGYGIDENTALFVDGTQGRVIGEYGAVIVDMAGAAYDRQGRTIDGIAFSYLDDGDSFDLPDHRVTPDMHKRPVLASEIAYRAPARSPRNVFGAYTLYDLLARLVLGDSTAYAADRARAIEPKAGIATTVELGRVPDRSRGLIALRDDMLRMTALDFRAAVAARKLDAAQLAASRRAALARDYGIAPGDDARLVLLGSSPLRCNALMRDLARDCMRDHTGPVGIIAAASSEPRNEAQSWLRAFRRHGVEAIDLGLTIDNVELADPALVERIAGLRAIVLAGGNQIRLVETLLHRGEVTPVLLAIARAYAAGATIVAVAGAASALSGSMIAGGSSYEALRFGVASDMGRRGIVIQEGLGLFGSAIVDQNLTAARRLARLVVACAEEGVRYGLGLCEESGVVAGHDNAHLTVIGRHGAVLVDIDLLRTALQGDDFRTEGTKLHMALPGDVIDLDTGTVTRAAPRTGMPNADPLNADNTPDAAMPDADTRLAQLVGDLLEDCASRRGAGGPPHDGPIALRFTATGNGSGLLDIESIRDRDT
ncbi:cyanophycinase [Nguyenibacter sp. L1]|uniref:cyanophycinase n=1 Tax=Nguyenibacter sp. L1 TaxID=3049350 RepID=UPI002B49B375|nr:cyanophycinase [Nguyenibacter sp. L1]WRH87784.1 cyanophycinase [Nguyenibacter sp. L1]